MEPHVDWRAALSLCVSLLHQSPVAFVPAHPVKMVRDTPAGSKQWRSDWHGFITLLSWHV